MEEKLEDIDIMSEIEEKIETLDTTRRTRIRFSQR